MDMVMIHFLFMMLVGILCSSHALTIHVGGRDGWTLKPSENYNHWAARYRFQINDTLVFKYKKGEDLVLVVNQDDYNKCTKNNPIKNLSDGDSTFKFDTSGHFYFISGHDQNCEKGQKLIITVLSEGHHLSPPSDTPIQPPSHAPVIPTKPPSPTHDTPTPSTSPTPKQSPPQSPPPPAKTPTQAPPTSNTQPPHVVPTPPSVVPSQSPEIENADDPYYAPAPAPSASSEMRATSVLLAGISFVASIMIPIALA